MLVNKSFFFFNVFILDCIVSGMYVHMSCIQKTKDCMLRVFIFLIIIPDLSKKEHILHILSKKKRKKENLLLSVMAINAIINILIVYSITTPHEQIF
jgi:hypothetical protein